LYRRFCYTNICEIIWQAPLFSSGLFCSCFVPFLDAWLLSMTLCFSRVLFDVSVNFPFLMLGYAA